LLVDIDNASIIYGTETVVDDVSLCIHSGEFVGLIGPNGAGKTTLLRTMLGLIKPTVGSITKAQASRIGYIPQRSAMHDSQIPISVLEVVMLGTRSRDIAMQCLQSVGMADAAQKPFAQLSGGQQQRVSIAKALANDPHMLVLDEPTTGIDERSQSEFYDILQSLQKKGLTIIMVSHDVDAVLRLVTRVICLNRTVIYDGPAEHFEADKYMPQFYKAQHRLLHHHHGAPHV
jgi:zinc transport system ATP-binding protein